MLNKMSLLEPGESLKIPSKAFDLISSQIKICRQLQKAVYFYTTKTNRIVFFSYLCRNHSTKGGGGL